MKGSTEGGREALGGSSEGIAYQKPQKRGGSRRKFRAKWLGV